VCTMIMINVLVVAKDIFFMLELCLHFRVDLFPLMMERDITLPSAILVSVVNVVADQFLL